MNRLFNFFGDFLDLLLPVIAAIAVTILLFAVVITIALIAKEIQ